MIKSCFTRDRKCPFLFQPHSLIAKYGQLDNNTVEVKKLPVNILLPSHPGRTLRWWLKDFLSNPKLASPLYRQQTAASERASSLLFSTENFSVIKKVWDTFADFNYTSFWVLISVYSSSVFCPETELHGGTPGNLCPSGTFLSHYSEVLSLKSPSTQGGKSAFLALS